MSELIKHLEESATLAYEIADKATKPFDRIQNEALGDFLAAQARQFRKAV